MREWLSVSLLAGNLAFGWLANQAGSAEPSPATPTVEEDRKTSGEIPLEERIAGLAERLGDADFRERQRATAEIAALGRLAVPTLRQALQSDDAEVRFRARHALKVIRELDRERLVEAFLLGEQLEDADELPGWRHFQAAAGSGAKSGQLFAQMLQDEGSFLDRVYDSEPQLVPLLLAQRTGDLHEDLKRNRPISVSSVATLLLVAGREDIELSNQMGMMSLCYRTEFDRAIRTGPGEDALRGLLGRVVARVTDESLYAQRFHFALNYDLPEGLEPARRVLADRVGIPHVRYGAVLVVAKLGQPDDLRLIEGMLDDAGEVASQHRVDRRQITTQVRGIALAALVQRAGEPLTDYGLNNVRLDPKLLFQTTSVGFASDEEREKAIAKWRSRQPASVSP